MLNGPNLINLKVFGLAIILLTILVIVDSTCSMSILLVDISISLHKKR